MKPEPDAVAVKVAGVWTDQVPAVSIPPVTPPEVRAEIVDLVGTELGAWLDSPNEQASNNIQIITYSCGGAALIAMA